MSYYDRKLAKHERGLQHLATIGLMLFALVAAGCASNPYHNARNFAVAGIAADVASTHRAIERGCVESNPLYGKDANIEKIAIINLALIGVIWWVAGKLEESNGPTWPLWVVGALRAGVAIRNENVDC